MVFQLIKRHFSKNTPAMLLLFFCQFVSLLAVIFFFSLNVARDNYNKGFKEDLHSIKLTCGQLDTALLADAFNEGIYKNISLYVTDENGNDVRQVYRCRNVRPLDLEKGRYFSETEVLEKRRVVMVTFPALMSDPTLEVGNSLTLWGEEYEIIGVFGSANLQVEIPMQDGIYDNAKLTFFVSDDVPLSEYPQYAEQLKNALSASTVSYTPEEAAVNKISLASSAVSLPIFLIANLNFMALYVYLLMREKDTLSIFRMCGCTEKRCNFLLLGEFMLLALPPYFLASVTYQFGLSWVLPYMNPLVSNDMQLSDYGLVLLVYLAGLLLVFVPVIWRYGRKSPVALHRNT